MYSIVSIYIYIYIYTRPKFQGRPTLWLRYSTFLPSSKRPSICESFTLVRAIVRYRTSLSDQHPRPKWKPTGFDVKMIHIRMIWRVACFRKHPHELGLLGESAKDIFLKIHDWLVSESQTLRNSLHVPLPALATLARGVSNKCSPVASDFTYEKIHELGNYSHLTVFYTYWERD